MNLNYSLLVDVKVIITTIKSVRIVNIREYVKKKRNYWSEVIILYTDLDNSYILEVKNKVVFTNKKGNIWTLETNDRLVNAYLKQIKEVYDLDI